MMANPDLPGGPGRRLSRAATVASWAVPVVVTILNVLLVVGVSAGPRVALLVLCLVSLGAGLLVAVRPRRRPESGVSEPDDPERLFVEDLDLTLRVGSTADEDHVRELRSTRFSRPLDHRKLTLISPYVGSENEKVSPNPLLRVLNAPVEASWMPSGIGIDGRGIVHFTPAAAGRDELRWEINYAIPNGLWNPLRSVGLDVFRYDVRSIDIGEFTIRFIFDSPAVAVSVEERNRRGTVSDAELDSDGNWSVLWRADQPTAPTRYEFGLRVDWGRSVNAEPPSRMNRNGC
ncbi:hypothetical protein KZ829_15240 [Actinoplanes hulinensis]|uniref:Uncharacterized protein n=1 Tax=Actinoplanes hulinensis TaxID=1144547 RepID=A0ABS7B363_9ACTN|nr:hypothetical protein [Actinoplanes hulinensis]MBW6435096.1 hypothetical protein [Actinoplanes hulinensis]